jgi:hypothetical protein
VVRAVAKHSLVALTVGLAAGVTIVCLSAAGMQGEPLRMGVVVASVVTAIKVTRT